MNFGETIKSNENRSEFSVLKPGTYHVEITDGTVKQSQSGGTYVEFKFRVLEGEAMNRILFGRFNIINNNAEAARIGRQQLVSLADAVGIVDPCDTDPFIGKHCLADVVIRPAQGQFAESNGIKRYKKYEGNYTPAPVAPSVNDTPAQTAKRPAWLNK